jgi:ribonuclease VapC
MIALDTSAIIAIALNEREASDFNRQIALQEAIVGAPTLVESQLVLSQRASASAGDFLNLFVQRPSIHPVAFTLEMFWVAQDAFERFGRGKGHPAKLNFGDCLSYAVAKFHNVPLLFKGDDFPLTDIRPALP